MASLSTAQIRKENENRDVASITHLKLSLRALSDISCLIDFVNLERLDLSSNILSSLEALASCANLKWLSVSQNKLQSLKGIEGLSKLMVLNASRNKLTSMYEVRSLTCLRALILNDNDIASICRLDQLKCLNTLVLSRNPIDDIGKSLEKVKSITKLSLSNCQIRTIGSSLRYCVELKEVRLAHNEIMTLPTDLSQNSKIRMLDLGNNLISKRSDLKVLSSLQYLKNLNLHGNPISQNDKLSGKVKNILPNLQIFNAKPIEQDNEENFMKNKINRNKDDHSLDIASDLKAEKKLEGKSTNADSSAKKNIANESEGNSPFSATEIETRRKGKRTNARVIEEIKSEGLYYGETNDLEMRREVKRKRAKVKEESQLIKGIGVGDVERGREIKRKKAKVKEENQLKVIDDGETNDLTMGKEVKRKKAKVKEESQPEGIDDGETTFEELVLSSRAKDPTKSGQRKKDMQALSGVVSIHCKKTKKSAKNTKMGCLALDLLPQAPEVGLGGPSTWDD